MKEIWKDIPGFENLYMISNRGRVKSLPRYRASGRILKQLSQSSGHVFVGLSKNGKEKHYFISQLVLLAFVGLPPSRMECCHNDGNPNNNCLENLRYDTHKNNMHDMKKHGTFSSPPIHYGSKNPNAKLTEKDIIKIRKLFRNKIRVIEIANLFNMHYSTIYDIRNKKTWNHVNE